MVAPGSAMGRAARCRAARRPIDWASLARRRGCVAGQPASSTWECCPTGAADRCRPFRRYGPHPTGADAIGPQPAARAVAARSARAGRTIMLVPGDEAACRAWAARQGFQLDVLDRDFPAFSDACRWIWARMSRGLISDDDLAAKLARLRSRITEASMHSIIRDEHGRFVPVVRPKHSQAASVKRSRDRTDRIARARKQTKDGSRRRSG